MQMVAVVAPDVEDELQVDSIDTVVVVAVGEVDIPRDGNQQVVAVGRELVMMRQQDIVDATAVLHMH